MNCCNLPNPTLVTYLEGVNLYLEWNRAWFDFYLNFYKIYLPKQ
jgi:hypothetical protein